MFGGLSLLSECAFPTHGSKRPSAEPKPADTHIALPEPDYSRTLASHLSDVRGLNGSTIMVAELERLVEDCKPDTANFRFITREKANSLVHELQQKANTQASILLTNLTINHETLLSFLESRKILIA